MNRNTKILIVTLVSVAVIIIGVSVAGQNSNKLGVFLASSITSTSLHVNSTSTQIIATSTSLGRLILQNGVVAGGADVYCSFGVGATSTQGMYISYATSSLLSRADITDPNLLAKGVTCIGSSTLSVIQY